jgi:hypothetical protein
MYTALALRVEATLLLTINHYQCYCAVLPFTLLQALLLCYLTATLLLLYCCSTATLLLPYCCATLHLHLTAGLHTP